MLPSALSAWDLGNISFVKICLALQLTYFGFKSVPRTYPARVNVRHFSGDPFHAAVQPSNQKGIELIFTLQSQDFQNISWF